MEKLLNDDGLPQANVSDERIQSLLPILKLSEIFATLPIEGHVHIIIKPPPAQSTDEEASLDEKYDIVTALRTSSFLLVVVVYIIS